jgi:hypothetical protein
LGLNLDEPTSKLPTIEVQVEETMIWTTMPFGRHIGRTLPQIVLSDPNYFFWLAEKLYGRLMTEAELLVRRARNIKIPKPNPKKWAIEYRRDRDDRFLGIGIVKADSHAHSLSERLPHLDLAYVRRGNVHDTRDCRRVIRDFRRLYFDGLNLTKRRCEEFFEKEDNFIKSGW